MKHSVAFHIWRDRFKKETSFRSTECCKLTLSLRRNFLAVQLTRAEDTGFQAFENKLVLSDQES